MILRHTNPKNGTVARCHFKKIYSQGTGMFATGMSKDIKQKFNFVNIAGNVFTELNKDTLHIIEFDE
jgi:hypothetical protein